MGWLSKAFRTAAKHGDKIALQKLLPHVKAEDLLPIPNKKNTKEDEKNIFVEAEINGDLKDLYEHFDSPEYADEDLSTDANDTVLMLGARTGDAQFFSMLLTIPRVETVINFQNPSNETALLVAEKEGQSENVLTLLQQPKIDVKLKDNNNETVLTYAAAKNDLAVVNVLLLHHHQTDVNSRTTANDTALTIAARKGHTEVVASLLKHITIDVNAVNEAGETALICAAREGHTGTVAALLAHPHIDPNAIKMGYKDTALMWAARNNHTSTFLHLLAHPSVDATITNKDGQTALDLATTDELALILRVYNKRSSSGSEKSAAEPRVTLDKKRRSHADVTYPQANVMLVKSPPPSVLERVHKLLPPPIQPFLYPTLGLVCLAALYILSHLLRKKPKANAVRTSATTGASGIAKQPGKRQLSQKGGPRPVKFPVEKEVCCPFCPEVSLIAIRNRHIDCLRVGLEVCGPHIDACTLACRSNLVDYLEVLRDHNSPWTEQTSTAAASLGHYEALKYVLEGGCAPGNDIVLCAARVGSLPVLMYLVEDQGLYMREDGTVFGAAFERAHFECLTYLVYQGCPFGLYTFPGPDMWPVFVRYRQEDSAYDARLALCIEFMISRNNNWPGDNNLTAFLDAHRLTFPLSVARIQAEEWIV